MIDVQRFYAVGCSQEADGGIYLCRFDGKQAVPEHFFALPGANYLAYSPDKRRLYASSSTGPERRGFVAAFAVLPDGTLEALGSCDSGGSSCCHLAVSPDGRRLYAANYLSGSVAGFRLGEDGAILGIAEFDQHTGCGVDSYRQTCPHAHFAGFSPDGGYLLSADLGTDTVFAYPYASSSGIDVGQAVKSRIFPPGSGPRHLIFEPEGTCLLVTEMGNTLQRFAFAKGRLEFAGRVPTLPEGANDSKAAALRISPDGRFVLVSNRGYDSIAVFERRTLGMTALVPSGGKSPRDFAFLADGRTVAVSNEFAPNVVFFTFDAEHGTLERTGGELALVRPLCILPAR